MQTRHAPLTHDVGVECVAERRLHAAVGHCLGGRATKAAGEGAAPDLLVCAWRVCNVSGFSCACKVSGFANSTPARFSLLRATSLAALLRTAAAACLQQGALCWLSWAAARAVLVAQAHKPKAAVDSPLEKKARTLWRCSSLMPPCVRVASVRVCA